ncbi:prolipoprotein diacylglyceryl transferase [Candidatus Parcubacteria bacterium]|nr:prolipoprotein diacylglyceryl transferase [Candidatus Parcubacteria bacterium]MBT3948612.1 prolipoprotein diacylglyceryl transferase [Candidatus Parcubacteria bacterium]
MLVNNIDPILLNLGSFTIRWYGLFLALGVVLAILIYTKLFKEKGYKVELVYDLSIWLVIGGLIGARLGHIVFYNLEYFLKNPIEIFMIHHGGLASHGMTIGLLLTLLLYKKIKKIELKKYIDLLIIPIPILAAFIRMGNFFNSEIIGKPTELPWGVHFARINPTIDSNIAMLRHPSQIYEALLALSIFFILYFVYKKYQGRLPQLFIFNLFLVLYFSTRFLVEFVKERHTLEGVLSMGQWLSIPFVIWGIWWFVMQRKKDV